MKHIDIGPIRDSIRRITYIRISPMATQQYFHNDLNNIYCVFWFEYDLTIRILISRFHDYVLTDQVCPPIRYSSHGFYLP